MELQFPNLSAPQTFRIWKQMIATWLCGFAPNVSFPLWRNYQILKCALHVWRTTTFLSHPPYPKIGFVEAVKVSTRERPMPFANAINAILLKRFSSNVWRPLIRHPMTFHNFGVLNLVLTSVIKCPVPNAPRSQGCNSQPSTPNPYAPTPSATEADRKAAQLQPNSLPCSNFFILPTLP